MAVQNQDIDVDELFNVSLSAFDSAGKMSPISSVENTTVMSGGNALSSQDISSEGTNVESESNESSSLEEKEGSLSLLNKTASTKGGDESALQSSTLNVIKNVEQREDTKRGEYDELKPAITSEKDVPVVGRNDYRDTFFCDCNSPAADTRVSLCEEVQEKIRLILFVNGDTSVFSYVNNILRDHFRQNPSVVVDAKRALISTLSSLETSCDDDILTSS